MNQLSDVKNFKADLRKNQNDMGTNPKSAKQAVKNLKLEILTKEDLFLYCASLNYLNAYIKTGGGKKQELARLLSETFPTMKFKNGYGFKKFINVALLAILGNDFDGVTFTLFPKENNLVMITINGLQFSYHGVCVYSNVLEDIKKEKEKLKKGQTTKVAYKEWEGLRLQPVAQKLFDFAKDLEGLSGEMYFQNNNENDHHNDCVNE